MRFLRVQRACACVCVSERARTYNLLYLTTNVIFGLFNHKWIRMAAAGICRKMPETESSVVNMLARFSDKSSNAIRTCAPIRHNLNNTHLHTHTHLVGILRRIKAFLVGFRKMLFITIEETLRRKMCTNCIALGDSLRPELYSKAPENVWTGFGGRRLSY